MTGDLVEAYHGVYTSSKEIMKNKQRHLYINMLDLLTRTTKAACSSTKDLITEDYVKFWYMEILPLVFDEDKTIQDHAICAIENSLQCINPSKVQSLPEWPTIKSTIIDYSNKLHTMRQISNSNWHKIWCLLIRILNKEILKGATVINTFLSIVELGFRSNDYKIRAEAFLCWKVLVEIFAKHNEIFSPKRIKLICIPLKSSQSKTLETAVNKFKVWWYFLCKLNDKIENYYDTAFEPFLLFCFGLSDKNSTAAQVKNYPIVKQMAIACLIEMLGPSTKETQCLLEATGLERPDAPLINTSLMIKCRHAILNASFEATIMIAEKSPDRNKLFENLWKNLFAQILKTNELNFYFDCCSKIKSIMDTEVYKSESVLQQYFLFIIEILGTYNSFPFANYENINDFQKLCQVILEITELVNKKDMKCPTTLTQTIINNIYDLEKFKKSVKYWDIQKYLIENTMKEDDINFSIKMCVWRKISEQLVNYLNERLFEFRIEKNAEVVNKWLFWPLEKCGAVNVIDDSFLSSWKNLVIAASKAEGHCNFSRLVSGKLKTLFEMENRPQKLPEILGIFISALDVTFDKSSMPVEAFELINCALSKPVKKGETNNKVISALAAYINSLQENQIIEAFDHFKTITLTLINASNLHSYTKHVFEEYKRALSDKLKSGKAKDKKLLKEFRDLFKSDSHAFVIIPTPWSFNPDKLTEHQKEKMKEKRSDIPALYNDISHDISHSQDIIKPWTPNKIVIAKGKNSEEIVLENKDDNDVEVVDPLDGVGLFENENANIALEKCDDNLIKSTENAFVERSVPDTDIKSDKNLDVDAEKTGAKEKVNTKVEESKETEEPEKRNKKIFTEEDEELLKKYNIQVDDEKRKFSILRQLKTIEIDTVEGKTFVKVQEKLRSKRSGKQDAGKQQSASKRSRESKDDKNAVNEENKKKKTARKSLAFEKKEGSKEESSKKDISKENKTENKSTSSNNSMDEVIESSQEPSQSILAKKVALRKSLSSNNRSNSPNRSVLNFIKSPDVTKKKQETSKQNESPVKVDEKPLEKSWICEENIKPRPKSPRTCTTPRKSPDVTKQETSKQNDSPAKANPKPLERFWNCEDNIKTRPKSPRTCTTPRKSPDVTKQETSKQNDSPAKANQKPLERFWNCEENIKTRPKSPRTCTTPKTPEQKKKETSKPSDSPAKVNETPLKRTWNCEENIKTRPKSPRTCNSPRKSEVALEVNVRENSQIPLENNADKLINQSNSALDEKINSSCVDIISNNEEVIVVEDDVNFMTNRENCKSPFREPRVFRSSPRKSPFKNANKADIPTPESSTKVVDVEIREVTNSHPLSDIQKHPFATASSETVISPLRSPFSCDKETQNSSTNSLNRSIVSSPEFKDCEERNAEFLNNTLNISPIVNNQENNNDKLKSDDNNCAPNESFKNTPDEIVKPSFTEIEKLPSPKKQLKAPNSLPSSPPDRKFTTTTESPVVKPKPMSQLTGRGAQLINMIRNRKLDNASKMPVNALMTAKIETKASPEKASQGQHPQQNSPNNDEAMVPVSLQHNDLLIFSKVLPSPHASPSVSILKRKFRQDSFDDIESPANKRKRVSFHDPPVSVTKEYVKHAEEDRASKPGFNRCLMPDKTSTPQNNNVKHSFKRKSRVDSMIEIAKFADSPVQATEADICNASRNTTIEQTSVDMDSLKWNGTSESGAAQNDESSLTPSPSLYFPDDAGVFSYIFEKYHIEDILEKYLSAGKTITNKSVRAITKEISSAMTEDSKLKTNVLEMLSEKHPKEFLDHAIQENLSSVVCDRLNPSSVVEFVCEKAKINTGMRKRLLEQVQSMLTDKLSEEKYEFLLALLRNHQMADDQVIECIDVIVQRHKSRKLNEPGDVSDVSMPHS